MKLIKLDTGDDKRTHFFAELNRVNDRMFQVTISGRAIRDGPMKMGLQVNNWSAAVRDALHMMCLMRACVQLKLGMEVELPERLEHLRKFVPQMLAMVEGVDNIGRN